MHVRKESDPTRKRQLVVGVLILALLGSALALVSTSSGSTDKGQAGAAKPVIISTGKGFGEVYAAKRSTLAKTLFKAKLLPASGMARNIALAGLGRADRKVNYNLALKCWKNNGCDTGTGGKLTVAYIEQFGENVYREMSKMEFILQALTYPEIGKIIYTSAHAFTSTPSDPLADFRAAIAQGADVIVTVTNSAEPVLRREWLKPGAHINAVGSCFPHARELDSETVAASSLFVDRRESAENEAGDYLLALKEGAISPGHIRAEIGEVLIGAKPGRTTDDEITLFKSLGLAVEDVAAAEHVYGKAKQFGIGTWVEF